MDINWFESFLYGIVSGLTELLPVSSKAHQRILMSLFGIESSSPFMDLAAEIGVLAAVLLAAVPTLRRLKREQEFVRSRRRRRKRAPNMQLVFDWSLLRTACIPLLLGFLFYGKVQALGTMVPVIALFLALNGAILFLPTLLTTANKDSRNMSGVDSILVGLGGMLGYFPGVSRVGSLVSAATARGADTQQAFKWSLLLSIPALAGILIFDFYSIVSGDVPGPEAAFLGKCVLVAVSSCVGAASAIRIMKALSARSGFTGFSYYCWGAALFMIILYLF